MMKLKFRCQGPWSHLEEHQIIEGGGAIIMAIMRNGKCMTSCPFPIHQWEEEEDEGEEG